MGAHSDSGRTSTMYLHRRRVVREVWLPRAENIQAAYVDYVPFLFSLATFFPCEDNKLIDLVILYCVVMPFYPSSTKRHETRFLATDFPLFNLDARSMLMTHKCRGSIVAFSISKSVEPNEEQKERISSFQ